LFFILQVLKPIANRKDSLWFFTLQASKPIAKRKKSYGLLFKVYGSFPHASKLMLTRRIVYGLVAFNYI
jgi:hypothetical protein